jgi:hypothetical protein
MLAEFYLAGIKAHAGGGEGRTLLGDNTGVSCCNPLGPRVLEFVFQLESLLYTYIGD